MSKSKCIYCSSRKGKRFCPVVNGLICSQCCGEYSSREFNCPEDCNYYKTILKNRYQKESESVIDEEIKKIRPDVVGYDILSKTEKHSLMAYKIEMTFQRIHLDDAGFSDPKVIELLKLVYFRYYCNKSITPPEDEIILQLLENYPVLKTELDRDVSEDDQKKIILRLILSAKNMSGGPFGDYGYLNFLKNNLGKDMPDDTYIMEDKWGHKRKEKIKG